LTPWQVPATVRGPLGAEFRAGQQGMSVAIGDMCRPDPGFMDQAADQVIVVEDAASRPAHEMAFEFGFDAQLRPRRERWTS
jgi:hypothetical protein